MDVEKILRLERAHGIPLIVGPPEIVALLADEHFAAVLDPTGLWRTQ